MSVHATDMAHYLRKGLPKWMNSSRMILPTADRCSFIVNCGDGKGPMRVTVEDSGWFGLTMEELDALEGDDD